MKRFRSVQTRPNASILWPYEIASTTKYGENPDLVSKTRTLSEDQLTLVTDFIFPDSWDIEAVRSEPNRLSSIDTMLEYMLENGITRSDSVDDI